MVNKLLPDASQNKKYFLFLNASPQLQAMVVRHPPIEILPGICFLARHQRAIAYVSRPKMFSVWNENTKKKLYEIFCLKKNCFRFIILQCCYGAGYIVFTALLFF